MERYLFLGVILPERAQITLTYNETFTHIASGAAGNVRISIRLNQLAVFIESEHDWDIHTLRNTVKNIVQNQLAMVGYLKGYSYDVEVTRVFSQGRGIDEVFGIDIPILSERNKDLDLEDALARLREMTIGPNGVFLYRCFTDLSASMRHADDTAFYCYRAIESLRHHCAAEHSLSDKNKTTQWEKFRQVSGCTKETLDQIMKAAEPLRHGEPSEPSRGSPEFRAKLFMATWDIVDNYLNGVQQNRPPSSVQ